MTTTDTALTEPVAPAITCQDRPGWAMPILAGLLALAVYVVTLAPTVTSEDSGEFIGAAFFFGVPHPPGYPLWTILCGLFIKLIPIGGIAWRANLFSAVCAALAIAVFCRILIMCGLSRWAALSGALVCAFGRVLWSQSVITEVYTLHFLIFTLIAWCVLRWREGYQNRWLLLASLFLGLGMSNHQTIGFTGVAAATWVLVQQPRLLLRGRLVAVCTLTFLVGLLPHAYMYVRAKADPPVNWGETKTVRALWDHVSRRQYKSSDPQAKRPVRSTWSHLKGELQLVSEYCRREYTTALAAVGLTGFLFLLKRGKRDVLLLWLLLAICNVGFYIMTTGFGFSTRIDRWCNQVFFLPVFACLAIAIACALNGLFDLNRWVARTRAGSLGCCLRGTTIALVLSLTVTPALAHFRDNNMRQYWYAYDHAKNILDTMLPNGLIIPSGDHNTFPMMYLVLVEKYRPDITIADKYGYIEPSLYAEMPNNPGKPRTLDERDAIEEWMIRHARRPVYYTAKRQSLVANARMIHVGVLYHLLPGTKTLDTQSVWASYRYRNLEGMPAPRDFGADNILADWEFFQGLRALEEKRRDDAVQHFALSEGYGWGIKELLNNIGSALAEYGHTDDAINYYSKAARMDALYEAPLWNMARVHKNLKQFGKAEEAFKKLTAINPDDFRTWGELGFLAAGAGRWDAAVSCWNNSLRLNPAQSQIIEELHSYYTSARQAPSTQPPSTSRNALDSVTSAPASAPTTRASGVTPPGGRQ